MKEYPTHAALAGALKADLFVAYSEMEAFLYVWRDEIPAHLWGRLEEMRDEIKSKLDKEVAE